MSLTVSKRAISAYSSKSSRRASGIVLFSEVIQNFPRFRNKELTRMAVLIHPDTFDLYTFVPEKFIIEDLIVTERKSRLVHTLTGQKLTPERVRWEFFHTTNNKKQNLGDVVFFNNKANMNRVKKCYKRKYDEFLSDGFHREYDMVFKSIIQDISRE